MYVTLSQPCTADFFNNNNNNIIFLLYVQMEEKEKVLFPAVTVCNFNIIKLSELDSKNKFVGLQNVEKLSESGELQILLQ